MTITIVDFSWYGNTFDPVSNGLLRDALRRRGSKAEIVNRTRDDQIDAPSPGVWLRYDLRTPADLIWVVSYAQRLAQAGCRVWPTAESIDAAEDKWLTAIALRQANVAVPPTTLANEAMAGPFPIIVKPRVGWGARQTQVFHSPTDPELSAVSTENYIVQPFIAHERVLIAAVTETRPIVCIEDIGGGLNGVGRGSAIPFPKGADVLAARALAAVGLVTGTVDLIEAPAGLRVLEVNSAPRITYPHIPQVNLADPMVDAVLAWMEQP